MSVTFKDNSAAVLAAMARAKKKTLTALGQAGVEVTVDYMQSHYGKAIRITGDLQRDVSSRIREADEKVDIGNSLSYAIPVHNGTRKMSGRPYIFDAVTQNGDIWEQITAENMKAEMK